MQYLKVRYGLNFRQKPMIKGVVMSIETTPNPAKIDSKITSKTTSNTPISTHISPPSSEPLAANSSHSLFSDEKFKLSGLDIVDGEPGKKSPSIFTRSERLNAVIKSNDAIADSIRTPVAEAPISGKASGEFWERTKSTLRMRYEAESTVIRKKIGDLESIREQLGLSQRKIAQLLLVDPSAWTRWTRMGEDAPPHIYRSLQWYLALQDKYPAMDVNFWLSTVAQVRSPVDEELRARGFKDMKQSMDGFSGDLSSIKMELESLRAKALRADNLEKEVAALAKRARRQYFLALAAALVGSCIAGIFASRFF
jgi:transcriptional regulator with XRE-family HTH domain